LVMNTKSIDDDSAKFFQIGGLPFVSADTGYVSGSIGNDGLSAALLKSAVNKLTGLFIIGNSLFLVDPSSKKFPTYEAICNEFGRFYLSFSYVTI